MVLLDMVRGCVEELCWFKIPHMPPAGSLKVLHAPARRGGIRRASQTKIYNLETGEFVSNPPFSKIYPTFRQERWIKKNRKPREQWI